MLSGRMCVCKQEMTSQECSSMEWGGGRVGVYISLAGGWIKRSEEEGGHGGANKK